VSVYERVYRRWDFRVLRLIRLYSWGWTARWAGGQLVRLLQEEATS
jgi:hypothetical protein